MIYLDSILLGILINKNMVENIVDIILNWSNLFWYVEFQSIFLDLLKFLIIT